MISLTFDDISLIPKYSDIQSRQDCETEIMIDDIKFNTPIIASPMDTICDIEMCTALNKLGALGILHRFNSIADHYDNCLELDFNRITYGAAIGVGRNSIERFDTLVNTNLDLVCIDVAHGHHKLVKDMIEHIKGYNEDIHIMAGNICTSEGAEDLISWGADSLRVGIGNGSMCETRIRAGVGVPQVTALENCISVSKHYNIPVISDGGCKTTGDVAKAIALGASAVMVGSLLAGTKETPGQISKTGMWPNEQLYKKYQGSASIDSKVSRGEKPINVEGNSKITPYKGKVKRIIDDINDGLRSAMSYVGARNIKEFWDKAEFVEVTQAGQIEAQPHGLI